MIHLPVVNDINPELFNWIALSLQDNMLTLKTDHMYLMHKCILISINDLKQLSNRVVKGGNKDRKEHWDILTGNNL